MKRNLSLLIITALSFLLGCGPKMEGKRENLVKERDRYLSKVNEQPLETLVSEGALTDVDGFEDIGKFKLTYYFDGLTKQLKRIENIETTNHVVSENFYFEDNDLLYISTQADAGPTHKLYVYKDNAINNTGLDFNYQKTLLHKAKVFQKDFKDNTKH